jgi:organic radical activating enzyme
MNSIKILDIFIGNKCNLSCLYCDTRSDVIKSKTHDPLIESIIEGIDLTRNKFHIDNYSILGGEALFYLDKLETIARHIRSFDQHTNILVPTNGRMIDKKINEIVRLITSYNLTLVICDHFSAFDDQSLSTELKQSTNNLVSKLGLVKGSSSDFFDQVLVDAPVDSLGDFEKEMVYLNQQGRITVFFKSQDEFQANYSLIHNKPKPFMTGDPQGSYKKGCCSAFCTFLYDRKLYKCAALGTLKKFLEYHNSQDDTDWQKYLSYQPLDLMCCSADEVTEFSNNKYKGIEQCDMCPNTSDHVFYRTPEKVIKLKNV